VQEDSALRSVGSDRPGSSGGSIVGCDSSGTGGDTLSRGGAVTRQVPVVATVLLFGRLIEGGGSGGGFGVVSLSWHLRLSSSWAADGSRPPSFRGGSSLGRLVDVAPIPWNLEESPDLGGCHSGPVCKVVGRHISHNVSEFL
jgi:hypothetical protein